MESPYSEMKMVIESEIKEYENRAEEYFQEIGDEDSGNILLAKADALRDIAVKLGLT